MSTQLTPDAYLFFDASDDGTNLTPTGNFVHISNGFNHPITENGDGNADLADTFIVPDISYSGYTIEVNGQDYAIFGPNAVGNYFLPYFDADESLAVLNGTAVTQLITKSGEDASVVNMCFAAGTLVASPEGPCKVETLRVGDLVTTDDGQAVPVKWIGRQVVSTRFGPAQRLMLVRVLAGALGDGLPLRDLVLTADHALLIDGLLINAGVLVNGGSIHYVPLSEMGDSYTVYHIETENHDVILAEGAPAETYIDYVGRQAFENYAEYLALYGEDRTIPEMAYSRISSARMLPPHLKARFPAGAAA